MKTGATTVSSRSFRKYIFARRRRRCSNDEDEDGEGERQRRLVHEYFRERNESRC